MGAALVVQAQPAVAGDVVLAPGERVPVLHVAKMRMSPVSVLGPEVPILAEGGRSGYGPVTGPSWNGF